MREGGGSSPQVERWGDKRAKGGEMCSAVHPLLPGLLLWVVHFCHFLLQGKLKPISCLPSYSDFNFIATNYLQL